MLRQAVLPVDTLFALYHRPALLLPDRQSIAGIAAAN
jgi:hypothetical protein